MLTRYTIDISYFIPGKFDEVANVVNRYHDCVWYASDIEVGDAGGNAGDDNRRRYVSHGYMIGSVETLKSIIKDISGCTNIWIAFCTKTVEHNDGSSDHMHIYYSKISLARIIPVYAAEYTARIPTYVDTDKEIYDLCLASVRTNS